MSDDLIYPLLLVVSGILTSGVIIILADRFFRTILRYFDLYPESRGVIRFSFKIVSRLIGVVVFLLFLRLALKALGLDFTTAFVGEIIHKTPNYITAAVIIALGFYLSRVLKESARSSEFEFKGHLLLFADLIIHTTFILTALLTIGIDITVFLELYKILLWLVGILFVLIIGLSVGIPIALSIYQKEQRAYKQKSRKRKR